MRELRLDAPYNTLNRRSYDVINSEAPKLKAKLWYSNKRSYGRTKEVSTHSSELKF